LTRKVAALLVRVLARTAATMYGSSETTFYVLAVYFGAVGIRKTRHAVPAALVGDLVAAAAAVAVCAWMFR
jgi:spore maturation protein B